jgi:hypothetical protein
MQAGFFTDFGRFEDRCVLEIVVSVQLIGRLTRY